jgi:formate dehydrogenase major subunit
MTNHLGDMQLSKAILVMGANPAVNHPVAMQHILKSKERNNAKIIVIDPRYTKTAAKSDIYVRIRTGTDVPFLYGMIRLAIKNGWTDKEFIRDRIYGYEKIAEEAEKWTPEQVADVCGCKAEELIKAATAFAAAKPGCLIWNQGWTQHTIGTSNTRLGPIMQMIYGNMGKEGGGCNILRGHDNVQGASDMCNLADSLPGYYGLAEGIWKYFADAWKVDYEWLKGRFKSKDIMEKNGFALSNFWMGVLNEENAVNNEGTPLKALVVIGNGISTVTQVHKIKEALDKLELVVFIDPYVNDAAVITDRGDNLFLLPAASQIETSGSVAATNRSYQWRSQVVNPLYESRPDHEILFDLAKRLGFYEEFVRSLGKGGGDYVWPEDATKELCGSIRSIGLGGITPERLKAHQENWHLFDPVTLAGYGKMEGSYYGLPWPCWSEKHPGTPVMYDVSKPVMLGGGMGFRENWGVEREEEGGKKVGLLAGNTPVGSSVKGGYARITAANIESFGIKLTNEEKAKVEGKNFATDRSGILVDKALAAGLCPYGNGRARAVAWNFPDQIPMHREPLHSFRQDLVAKYPTFPDKANHWRAAIRYKSEQDKEEWVKNYPVNVVTGRIVEHMGTGTETRASKYLAELAPEMFIEINPNLAGKLGVKDGDMVWVYGTSEGKIKVKAVYSYTIDENSIFLPQNFSGVWSGVSLADRYPEQTAPYALGECSTMVTSYGYDIITSCPETKCTLVRIEKA